MDVPVTEVTSPGARAMTTWPGSAATCHAPPGPHHGPPIGWLHGEPTAVSFLDCRLHEVTPTIEWSAGLSDAELLLLICREKHDIARNDRHDWYGLFGDGAELGQELRRDL